ncbi:hypothetical protein [Lacticaseibacillus songhuajiangensis]|jgi:hypothetical protein|uniref:hypothetical protein n=1 Tax=Lacticaseibacillus songhuajiangensis TaxID=1296539 RepID=UPI001CDBA88E|nr:hypothetical protein [Lacticaseibacillus songhuajiangensis]
MYERFFLEGTTATKYNVFKYLNERSTQSITVAQIAKAMNSSYSKAQHATESMISDLQAMQTQLGNDAAAAATDFRVSPSALRPRITVTTCSASPPPSSFTTKFSRARRSTWLNSPRNKA